MRSILRLSVLWLGVLAASAQARNLLTNGSFEDADGPLKGWITDYAWQGNRHYMGNAARVSVVTQESGRRNVAQLTSPGDAGVKLESMLLPFAQGAAYRATLKVKGGPYRIYFSGYQWRSGIPPHDAPTIQEMRAAYRSKAEAGQSGTWQTVTLDIPGTAASDLSVQHLQRVRFFTLYIWFSGSGYVDDVVITQVRAP